MSGVTIDGWSLSEEQLMKPREAAAVFAVSTTTVTRWADERLLVSGRTPGRQRRYSREQIEAIMRGDVKPGEPKPEQDEPKPEQDGGLLGRYAAAVTSALTGAGITCDTPHTGSQIEVGLDRDARLRWDRLTGWAISRGDSNQPADRRYLSIGLVPTPYNVAMEVLVWLSNPLALPDRALAYRCRTPREVDVLLAGVVTGQEGGAS